MSNVLVTGGSGFIAAHVVHQLLKVGYKVVTSVRSEAKIQGVLSTIPAGIPTEKLSFVIIPDIGAKGAFDKVVQDGNFDGIIHTATPFHFNIKSPNDLLDPAIQGTIGVLEAAKAFGPSVKRIVITSSTAAIINEAKGNWPGHLYSEEDWNPITWEEATSGNPTHAYRGAKKFAEKAAWDFLEKEKPHFDIVTLLPPYVFGPIVHSIDSIENLNTSNAALYPYLTGAAKEISKAPVPMWTDVRNLAEAHIRALEVPEASNKRVLISAGNWSFKQVADLLRKNFPERADKIPARLAEGLDENGYPIEGYFSPNNTRSKELLGIEYLDLEKTLVDFVASIAPLEAKAKGN